MRVPDRCPGATRRLGVSGRPAGSERARSALSRPGPGGPAGARAAVVGLLVALAACVSAPRAADWLDVGFRSPRQAFRTFQTAVAGDQADLEYRCLSRAFRRREGISSLLVYREFRERLLREAPSVRRIADAEVLELRRTGSHTAELEAEVRTLFRDVRFRVGFARQDFYELWGGERLIADGDVEFERSVAPRASASGLPGIAAWVPAPPEPQGPDAGAESEPSELRLGQEWKIDSIEVLTDDGPGTAAKE